MENLLGLNGKIYLNLIDKEIGTSLYKSYCKTPDVFNGRYYGVQEDITLLLNEVLSE